MNDIDRSVESLDFALRRRFGWREVSQEESLSIIDKKITDSKWNAAAKKIMAAVNRQIILSEDAMGLEAAFALGGAYFKDTGKKSLPTESLMNIPSRTAVANSYLFLDFQ